MRILCFIILFFAAEAYSQAPRFMPAPINSRSLNSIYPALSGNGSVLVYMNDYTDDDSYQILFTYKNEQRRWTRPAELEITKPYRLVMIGGYCLDFEGTTMLFSYTGGNSVGGFDLYESTLSNGKWSASKNLGAPVNSSAHDTYPALSPDGSKLYFTRCQGVLDGKGQDCEIMVAERKRGRFTGWEEPVALSSTINNGNALMPRILSDENSMYFRSGDPDNLKWYFTRLEDGEWSRPESMTFLNVLEGKDFVATYYRPDMVLTGVKNERGFFNLADIPVPEQFQPSKAIIKSGVITNEAGEPMRAEIRVLDFETGETVASASTDATTGEYSIILPEGKVYDFSIFPRRSPELYYATLLDYSELRAIRRESEDHQLKPVSEGTVFPIKAVAFEDNGASVDSRSEPELARLSRLIQDNADYRITINAYQDAVRVDSIASPDLPLVISDTVITYDVQVIPDSSGSEYPPMTVDQMDSLLAYWNDTLAVVMNDTDTLLANVLVASVTGKVDSVEVVEIHHTYHNDFTQGRADALMNALVSRGVPAARVSAIGHGEEKRPGARGVPAGMVEVVFTKD